MLNTNKKDKPKMAEKILCRSCKEEVHKDAKKCPFCRIDTPNPKEHKRYLIRLWSTIIILSLVIFAKCSRPSLKEEFAEEKETIEFKLKERNKGDYDYLLDKCKKYDELDDQSFNAKCDGFKYAPETQKHIKITEQFSVWDGSHINLVSTIKESLHDSSSFEHIHTMYWEKGDIVSIKMSFRANNAFGTPVTSTVIAEAGIDTGNITWMELEE